MTLLKSDILSDTYSQMRISGLTVIPTPEDLELGLTRLEGMAAEFFARNICTDYNFTDEPDPNDDSGLEIKYQQGYATNLAIRLLADFGKQAAPSLTTQASGTLSFMSEDTAVVRETTYPNRQARGSGNTLRYNRWARFYRLEPQAPIDCTTINITVDEINDYIESFTDYLNTDETIARFTIDGDDRIRVNTTSLNSDKNKVSYNVTALKVGWAVVVITIITSDSRVLPRGVNFNVEAIAVPSPVTGF